MSYKRIQLRSLHVGKLSVFGDSLPERLRSTSIGLVGVAVATGLVLIALVLRQDFPLISGAPVPDPAPRSEPVHKDAASKHLAGTPSKGATPGRAAQLVAGENGSAPSPSPSSPSPGGIALPVASPAPSVGGAGVEGRPRSQGVEKTDPEQSPAQAPPGSSPAAGTPPAASPPDEAGEISSEPPPEPPEPAPEPEPSHPGNGNAYGKGNGNGNGVGNDGVPPGQAAGQPHGHSAE